MKVSHICSFLLASAFGIAVANWSAAKSGRGTILPGATPTPTPTNTTDPDQDDEQSRQIVATEFLNTRPPRKGKPRASSTPSLPRTQNSASTLVGITVWRLRRAAAGDAGARLLEQKSDSATEFVAERVPSTTKFGKDDKVRLSFESMRTGYLYVIDREQYADGTYSDPYLIFPTLKISDGDNAIQPGRLIEIPNQDDRPPYFQTTRHRADQTGESLTFLVTSEPLPNLKVSSSYQKLEYEQVAQWEQKWKGSASRIELANHAGTTYTEAEKTAGANRENVISQDDPPPQTIYKVTTKGSDGFMITLPLQYQMTALPKGN
jgi:hypothetical protein